MRLKKALPALSLAALAVFLVTLPLFTASPLWGRASGKRWLAPAYDLGLSLTELKCLRMGVNPYDVWRGDVVVTGMKPSPTANGLVDWGRYHAEDADVNVLSPWAYTAFLPLGFVPERVAMAVYLLMEVLSLAIVFAVGLYWGRQLGMDGGWQRLLGTLPLLAVGLLVFKDFQNGNMAVFVLAAAALMTVCLHRGRDVLAGLCWAVAMLKPQTGLAFAIPLLLYRKWRTCFVAAATCLLASVPPALMCHTSVATMIAQTPTANTMQFWGCGTFPHFLLAFVPQGAAIRIGLAVGAVVCVLLTGWLGRALPEANLTKGGGGAMFSSLDARRHVLHDMDVFASSQPHDGLVLLPLPPCRPLEGTAFTFSPGADRAFASVHDPALWLLSRSDLHDTFARLP